MDVSALYIMTSYDFVILFLLVSFMPYVLLLLLTRGHMNFWVAQSISYGNGVNTLPLFAVVSSYPKNLEKDEGNCDRETRKGPKTGGKLPPNISA